MEVRRIKRNNNELYHHGVKGQRWGHRKQRYGDIRDTGGSRTKNTTGNSKGVKVRTIGYGTDVKKSVSTMEDDKKYGVFNDHFQQKTAVSRRQLNPSTAVKRTPVVEKKKDPYDELQKRINAKLDAQDAAFARSETHINNTNSTGNYSSPAGLYSQAKEEIEKERRSAQYKQDALISRLQNEARIKDSKKLVSKMKLFGKAFKEVHTENINKGINAVKSLFKRK